MHTLEDINVCLIIVYYLYATIKFDPSEINIRICNTTLMYEEQTSNLIIHLNVIFVLKFISIYFGATIKELHTVK